VGWILGLGLALVAGLGDIAGGYLPLMKRQPSRRLLIHWMALSAGYILAAALLDMVPEALAEYPKGTAFLFLGYIAIFLVESLFASHAHYPPAVEEHGHALIEVPRRGEPLLSETASIAALAGLLIHTFFDGVAIAAGFRISQGLGVLMFLAVFLHKVPEGFSVSSITLAAARSRGMAFSSAIAIATSTLLGAAAVLFISSNYGGINKALLALSAGTFLYISASDLVPATQRGESKSSPIFALLGVGAYYLSSHAVSLLGLK